MTVFLIRLSVLGQYIPSKTLLVLNSCCTPELPGEFRDAGTLIQIILNEFFWDVAWASVFKLIYRIENHCSAQRHITTDSYFCPTCILNVTWQDFFSSWGHWWHRGKMEHSEGLTHIGRFWVGFWKPHWVHQACLCPVSKAGCSLGWITVSKTHCEFSLSLSVSNGRNQ